MATGLENLWIYKLAEDLEIKVHEVTHRFPNDEIFRSVDQLRRSSASVSNNIAESYHKPTLKEKMRFLNISKGEIEETRRGIIKSARKKFLSSADAENINEKYTILMKGTNAYIRFLKLNHLDNHKPKP